MDDAERLDYLLYEHYIAPALQIMAPSIEGLVAVSRMAPILMDVPFFAVRDPIAGMLEAPLARRMGRPEPVTPQQLTATADPLATLVINRLPTTGSTSVAGA